MCKSTKVAESMTCLGDFSFLMGWRKVDLGGCEWVVRKRRL